MASGAEIHRKAQVMDMAYLLLLQDFRESTGNLFTPFMEWVSNFAVTWPVFIPVLIYWCISKRTGIFLMFSLYAGEILGYALKLTFCIDRPYVRDKRIIPVHKYSSYSFPSGHAAMAASVLGGLGVVSRKKAQWFSCRICGLSGLLIESLTEIT